jgi:two-component system chemotaxis response regulator CheB
LRIIFLLSDLLAYLPFSRAGEAFLLRILLMARLLAGAIFLTPPAHDLSVSGEHVEVTPALQERSCPLVNRLFTSAASSYGSGVIGVILTSLLTDGTAGLQAVKQAGV